MVFAQTNEHGANVLTQDRLKHFLSYDPKTGVFTRVFSRRSDLIGQVAGTLNEAGYIQIRVDGKVYLGHRLAWLYMTGEWPTEVDHRDLNKSNNRWLNLRSATRAQQIANTHLMSHNTVGLKGVGYVPRLKKWRARIYVDTREIHLGTFDTPEKAHAAYASAAQKHYGEFARV